jgi:hypothetical protein
VLLLKAGKCRRIDYSQEAWSGPGEDGVVGWWKSQLHAATSHKVRMAPSDVLLEYFRQLESIGDQQDSRYVLALFLIRRRVLRLEGREQLADGSQWLQLRCLRDDSRHRVRDVAPSDARIAQIEEQLVQLLYAGAQ